MPDYVPYHGNALPVGIGHSCGGKRMFCGVCGNHNPADAVACLRCGNITAPVANGLQSTPQGGLMPQAYSLTLLGNILTVLLPITALLWLLHLSDTGTAPASYQTGTSVHVSTIGLLLGAVMVAMIVLFLTWFYRARKNAGLSTWRQRWSPGWAVGAWFLPPVFAWFPYQIMADIWRAGRPPDRRVGAANAVLPGLWWALWVLAWITSFQYQHVESANISVTHYNLNFGGTTLSATFAAAAAIVLAVIVRMVSTGPVGHVLAPVNTGQT